MVRGTSAAVTTHRGEMDWDYTHNYTHTVLYRLSTLYSTIERRRKEKNNSLGIYLIKKHT